MIKTFQRDIPITYLHTDFVRTY